MVDSLRLALRDAWRALAASRTITAVTILTLAVGLAGTTALVTVVYGVLLKPLPFVDPHRVVVVWETRRDQDRLQNVVSPANYLEWRDANRVFSGLGAVSLTFRSTLTGAGSPPEDVPIQLVTHDLLPVLGVSPALGRNFLPEEDRRDSLTVMISHRLWQRRFASDPSIVGRNVTLNGQPTRVVGVLPRGFSLLDDTPDLWAPLGFDAATRDAAGTLDQGGRPAPAGHRAVAGAGEHGRRRRRARAEVAGLRHELGRQRGAHRGAGGRRRTPAAAARRRRSARAPRDCLCQRHRAAAGEGQRPDARDGDAGRARGHPRTPRPPGARRGDGAQRERRRARPLPRPRAALGVLAPRRGHAGGAAAGVGGDGRHGVRGVLWGSSS